MEAIYRKPGLSIEEAFKTYKSEKRDIELGMNMCDELGVSDFYAYFVCEEENKKYYGVYCKKCGWVDIVPPDQIQGSWHHCPNKAQAGSTL